MGWADLINGAAFAGFWGLCEQFGGPSRRRVWALVAAGAGMFLMGSHSGYEAGRARAAQDARQAVILANPEMPR